MEVAKSNRKHIGLFGRTNVGKSTIFNLITGQDISIISNIKGTTTDIVEKTLELSTLGPVVVFDTAGLDDESILGEERRNKTHKVFERCDIACIIVEDNLWSEPEDQLVDSLNKNKIPFILVFNEKNLGSSAVLRNKLNNSSMVYNSNISRDTFLTEFTDLIKKKLNVDSESEIGIFDDILNSKQTCIFVTPIDSGAPKGRLIMPQVQALRAALDLGIISLVVQPNELENTLNTLKYKPDLVVCDSQAVKFVIEHIPEDIKITTFSILFSRLKGGLYEELKGANTIDSISKTDKILIAEACTHHSQKDDIGTIKIPNLLKKYLGFSPNITHIHGHDFPNDLDTYKLIIHCGACMLTRKEKLNRIAKAKQSEVAITNYGMAISYLNGYLKRTSEIFIK
ncbi:MAG: [Bacteroidetes bacterium]|nr:[FeFe] hydrogenase H-cluster maturation GTPase HydF [Bacteroidota bacterium]